MGAGEGDSGAYGTIRGSGGEGRGQRRLWYYKGAVGAGGGDSGAYGTIRGQWGRGEGTAALMVL